MTTERLHPSQIAGLTASWSEDVRGLARAARTLVLEIAPALSEKVAFHSLCYYKPGAPYGAIGGNVCLLTGKDDHLELAFLHGASLPDPEGLLRELNKTVENLRQTSATLRTFPFFEADNLRRLAFFMATGSGKTLILHINLWQIFYYLKNGLHPEALVKRPDGRAEFDNIILIIIIRF